MSNTDLIARLRQMAAGLHDDMSTGAEAADALEAQASEIEALTKHGPPMQRGVRGDGTPWMGTMLDVLNDYKQAAEVEAGIRQEYGREIEALRADAAVWKCQVDSLKDALLKVLDTRNKEAKAAMSYQVARENFSDSSDERKAHERAIFAAGDAETEARTLLLTLKNMSGKAVTP